ncbi:MAG TPA: C39 family peptidase [Candidatus Saccharimonas sp.]|nr:C39 family peptidase [Candidatus Saccharimonas sp.]
MIERLLNVPYYRQIDAKSPLPAHWQERACGVLALKMVLDYHRAERGEAPTDLQELFDLAYEDGTGFTTAVGWRHEALVRAARHYGFRAWRRNWNLHTAGRELFIKEGADAATLGRLEAQQRREALPTLVETIEAGFPVVISVAKNFDEVDKGHLVVLTGLRREPELGRYHGFYYNDPYAPTEVDRKDRYVPIARFEDKWKHTAVFVEPK